MGTSHSQRHISPRNHNNSRSRSLGPLQRPTSNYEFSNQVPISLKKVQKIPIDTPQTKKLNGDTNASSNWRSVSAQNGESIINKDYSGQPYGVNESIHQQKIVRSMSSGMIDSYFSPIAKPSRTQNQIANNMSPASPSQGDLSIRRKIQLGASEQDSSSTSRQGLDASSLFTRDNPTLSYLPRESINDKGVIITNVRPPISAQSFHKMKQSLSRGSHIVQMEIQPSIEKHYGNDQYQIYSIPAQRQYIGWPQKEERNILYNSRNRYYSDAYQ